jgi:hypothetical protein
MIKIFVNVGKVGNSSSYCYTTKKSYYVEHLVVVEFPKKLMSFGSNF